MSLIDEDEALIASAVNGSAYAWERLVRRYESRVYNQGLRLTGNPSDAMDLVQEVFLGVYRNLHRFRGDSKFSSWVFRIAHNKAIDMNRRKKLVTVKPHGDDENFDFLDSLPGESRTEPESKLNEQELNSQVLNLLGTLSYDQRLLVECKVFQSLTFEEIAELQDVSVNTAKTRFYAALKKLKKASEEANVLPQN